MPIDKGGAIGFFEQARRAEEQKRQGVPAGLDHTKQTSPLGALPKLPFRAFGPGLGVPPE